MAGGRKTILPLVLAVVVFALLVPLTCDGSSGNPREFCQNVFFWRIPWSSIAGSAGAALMYGVPVIAAIFTFFVTRAVLARRTAASPNGADD